MDGNAFSGRFYAFMRSHSLPLKLAYFREWHWERLRPWVHFVPISREVREVPEIMRYFEEEEEGQEIAMRLAASGHDWAVKVLRKEDMEVWMFRLLLEYGRLIDDNRHELGYS
ncbi:capsule-associated protein CAP1 [Xylographa soralifera]|nr:capsule-associated protein CAP1 [Xylographa soralifera]